MKKQQIETTIETINAQLSELEEQRDQLISMKFRLEREEEDRKTKAWAERVSQARKQNIRVKEGRANAKFSKLNFFKRKRQERRERLDG